MKSYLFAALIFAMTFAYPLSPARSAHSRMVAPIEINVIPISPGAPQFGLIPVADQFRVCRIGDTQYKLQFPGGPMKLKINAFAESADVDVYVRRDQPVVRQDGTIIADFKAMLINQGEELELPLPGAPLLEEGTYFIAVGNCSTFAEANYTLFAFVFASSSQETVALINNVTQVGSIPAPASGCLLGQTQYTFSAASPSPCGPIPLYDIELRGDQNVDLYVRFNQRVTVEDGRIIADFVSRSGSDMESLFVGPVAQDGVFYVAVANCSAEKATYAVGVIFTHGDPPPPAQVTACAIERSMSGAFSLVIRGRNIRRGATVEVGGMTARKVKFRQPEQTGNSFAKVIAKGNVCNGLPGTIIIRNPGETCFRAFQCNATCSNQ